MYMDWISENNIMLFNQFLLFWRHSVTRFIYKQHFYKQHFYKQRQAGIGKNSSKC